MVIKDPWDCWPYSCSNFWAAIRLIGMPLVGTCIVCSMEDFPQVP